MIESKVFCCNRLKIQQKTILGYKNILDKNTYLLYYCIGYFCEEPNYYQKKGY